LPFKSKSNSPWPPFFKGGENCLQHHPNHQIDGLDPHEGRNHASHPVDQQVMNQQLLGRQPDPDGARFWEGQLSRGLRTDRLEPEVLVHGVRAGDEIGEPGRDSGAWSMLPSSNRRTAPGLVYASRGWGAAAAALLPSPVFLTREAVALS